MDINCKVTSNRVTIDLIYSPQCVVSVEYLRNRTLRNFDRFGIPKEAPRVLSYVANQNCLKVGRTVSRESYFDENGSARVGEREFMRDAVRVPSVRGEPYYSWRSRRGEPMAFATGYCSWVDERNY